MCVCVLATNIDVLMAVGEEDSLAATAERGISRSTDALIVYAPFCSTEFDFVLWGGSFRCHLGNHFIILLGRIGANFGRVPPPSLGKLYFLNIPLSTVQCLILIPDIVRKEGV